MTTFTRAEIGALGERLAADHLTGLGLRIVTRNWRCRYGELDVIACDEATRTLVFVEVQNPDRRRLWRPGTGGHRAESPTAASAGRAVAAGQDERWAAVRIDVIGVRIGYRRIPEIMHLQGIG